MDNEQIEAIEDKEDGVWDDELVFDPLNENQARIMKYIIVGIFLWLFLLAVYIISCFFIPYTKMLR